MEQCEKQIVAALLDSHAEGRALRRSTLAQRLPPRLRRRGIQQTFLRATRRPTGNVEGAIGRPILIEIEYNQWEAGAVLRVDSGLLSSLEVFTYDGPWPENAVITGVS